MRPRFTLEERQPSSLIPNPANFRRHPDSQLKALRQSLDEFGHVAAPIVNAKTGHLIDGHARVEMALADGEPTIPVNVVNLSPAAERRLLRSLDRIGAMALIDEQALDALIESIDDAALEQLLGEVAEPAGLPEGGGPEAARLTLAEQFGVPPFSVLDARQGYWQERKRAWIALGIQSELGRGEASRDGSPGDHRPAVTREGRYDGGDAYRYAGPNRSDHKPNRSDHKPSGPIPGGGGANTAYSRGRGRSGAVISNGEGGLVRRRAAARGYGTAGMAFDGGPSNALEGTPSGTSIFDPVLCELAYRWFCPEQGRVLDPFAGGSVRGIVAHSLGRSYVGIDLSEAQIHANRLQAQEIGVTPDWIVGDSRECVPLVGGDEFDFVFSCPPYADLEVYSDDPRDISTFAYPEFLVAYREIIAASVARLKENRFACFVVGDVRDEKGFYRAFVADTVRAFEDAGMRLYNDAMLVTAVGSLPIRLGKQFGSYRKLGKTHQNVLVFYRGDPRLIKEIAGDCQFGTIEEESADDGAPIEFLAAPELGAVVGVE